MVFYIGLLLFLIGPQLIYSITVSPDLKIKNATKTKTIRIHDIDNKTNKLNSDKTENLTKSINLADRNRRLIPYMTFYIPTEDENYDTDQQYDSRSQINQPNYHPQQSHQSNHDIYQQSEPQTLSIKNNPNEGVNSESSFIQHQPTYLTDEHSSNEPLNVQQIHLTNRPHSINSFQPSSSILYDNVRQVPLNLLSKGIVSQSQLQHHQQLLHQNQQQQHQLKYQHQEPNIESHLPSRENIPKYHLHHSHHISHQASQHHQPQQEQQQQQQQQYQQKLPVSPSANPILLHQGQPQSIAGKLFSSPFTPFNKIPGQFTPILYINEADATNINYHGKFLTQLPPSASPQPSVTTTAESITHENDESDSSNINDDKHTDSDVSLKQVLNENENDEYSKENIQLFKLKTLKQQKPNYQQHELQNSQQKPQHHQLYKYPIEYAQHPDEISEQQRLLHSPYYHNHHHHQQHQNNHLVHYQNSHHNHYNRVNANNHDLNSYNNEQILNEERDEHSIALVPLQKQHNSHHPQHKEQQQQQQQEQQQQQQQQQEQQQQQQQQQQQEHLHHEPNHIGHVQNIISATQRPTYKLVTEISQKYNSKQPQPTQTPIVVSTVEAQMTPQERYVAYLQQQLRQKYQNRYKDQQQSKTHTYNKEPETYSNVQIDPYLINASPSPNPPENHLYPENQRQHSQQPKYIYPGRAESENNDNPKKFIYMRPQDLQKNSRHPNQATNPGNYLQLLEVQTTEDQRHQQKQNYNFIPQLQPSSTPQTILIPVKQELAQHQQPQQAQKDLKLKPLFFVTTAKPILVTSVGSVYKYEPPQRLQPISLKQNHPTTTPNPFHSLKASLTIATNSPPSAHSNISFRPVGQKNNYNVQPTQYHSHKSPTFLVKPTYLPKPDVVAQPQQELEPHHSVDSNKVPLPPHLLNSYKSYSQLRHHNSHNNQHNVQNLEHNKIPYREYYPPQITPVLKLKPLQKNQNSNYEPENTSQSIVTTTPLYSTQITPIKSETNIKAYDSPVQSTDEDKKSSYEQEQVLKHNPQFVGQKLPNFKDTASLSEILRKLQESNHLPQTITPDNIDNSIKTLIRILNNLKQSQTIVENPPQHHEQDYNDYEDTPIENADPSKPGPNSGRPGIDYPNLAEIPPTSFNCKEQRYKGFFGDPETNCQVWHYCDLNGGQASFLCPNGTIFSQVALTCDWWFNVKCSSTAQLYVLNERLYKYILPFTPKFPEDYSGPLVDKYLALKFKEMEEKMNKEKQHENKEDENENSSKPDIEEDTIHEENALIDKNNPKLTDVEPNHESVNSHLEENNSESFSTDENEDEVKSVNLVDVEENRGAVDTGITYNRYSTSTTTEHPSSQSSPPPLTVKPIYVPSTTPSATIYSSTYIDSPSSNTVSSSTSIPTRTSTGNIDLRKLKLKHQNRLRLRQRFKLNRNRPVANRKPKVDVESEKVEVIEIKTDGSSGHIIPNLQQQQQTEYVYPE